MSRDAVFSLDWAAVAGSGFVVTVLLLALVERLRRTFAARQDLDGVGTRVNALQALYLQTREAADEARERSAVAEREQLRQWERVADQVIRPLERVTEKLEAVSEIQAAQAATLEQLGRRLDRTDDGRTPPTIQTRRRG